MSDVFEGRSRAQRILCGMIGNVLFGADVVPGTDVDWQAVYEEGRAQAVVLTAFANMQELSIPEPLAFEIRQTMKRHMVLAVQNYDHHSYLHALMEKHHIPYCVLKGVASAVYYPQVMTRQMGDVDFLIAGTDIERVSEILKADGFEKKEEGHEHHIVFQKGDMYFEMHFRPPGVPDGAAGTAVRDALKDILTASATYKEEPFECKVPAAFHHGLVMLMHMQRHLMSGGIGLRHLCDWAVFVNAFENETFETAFREKLQKTGLWIFAQIMSLTAHMAIGLPYRRWMGQDRVLARAMLGDMLSAGNFGVKDTQRSYEGLFISDRGTNGVRHSRIHDLIRSMNRMVYTHWPLSRTIKPLLPVGWMFLFVRRLIRVARGTREKIDVAAAYQKSAQRKALYARLKLFEADDD